MVRNRTASDYAAMLVSLFPQGFAWPRESGSFLGRLALSAGTELSRVHSEAQRVLDDSHPLTTVNGLSDWERCAGLPDACTPDDSRMQARRRALLLKLLRPGGQSAPYFVSLAAAYGYTITVETFKPFCADVSCADDAVYDAPGGGTLDASGNFTQDPHSGWRFAWLIRSASTPVEYFRADASCADEPLASFGDAQFECLMQKYAPAHCSLLFAYGEEE